MVNKKFNVKRLIIALIIIILIFVCLGAGIFFYEVSPKCKKCDKVSYVVESGFSLNMIFEDLEKKDIIRSATFMKIYSKINGNTSVEAGTYKIGASMSVKEILNTLKSGGKSSLETIDITFKEGKNVRDLANLLEEKKSSVTKKELVDTLKDQEYLDTLISKYWFLTDEIKNKDIRYSLEGYLFPDTYTFYKDTSAKVILEKMLDNTLVKLKEFKSDIESSEYSVHEILTLASMVELESGNTDDMNKVAGLFINRLRDEWSLGSCVTTYYAFDINQGDRDLSDEEIHDCSNKYNTRCTSYIGLPVGPIGNAGIRAIEASLYPEKHDYYYFVSDKNNNLYFTKDLIEHEKKKHELEAAGLWYEY